MEKQELIKLIESIDFEQVQSFKLNYLKEKPVDLMSKIRLNHYVMEKIL